MAAVLTAPVPVLDEESYLDIAAQLDPTQPYDWWRPWPPWGSAREADAFVYAHPPLFLMWVHAWGKLSGYGESTLRALKFAAGLPWAALLGWTVGRLAERTCTRPWLACAVWLAAPITVLGLQRGLMPDLMVTAFTTYAVCAWLEALGATEPRVARSWFVGGGVALALGCLTKYPALLLVPVLLLHGKARHRLRDTVPFWLVCGALWLGAELWLAGTYGRLHLWEVLGRAREIPRGPMSGRALGVAVRLSLGVGLLALVASGWRSLLGYAVIGAVGLLLVGIPDGTEPDRAMWVLVFAAVGVAAVALAGRELLSPRAPALDRTPGDGLLLGSWALVVIIGVVAGHNFAAPRYLLPAMAPLALIATRLFERRFDTRGLLILGAAIQAALAIGLTVAEHRFARAGADAAQLMVDRRPGDPGVFSGEWSFRWGMERAGWSLWTGEATPGQRIVSATHASPRAMPEGAVLEDAVAVGRSALRVVDAPAGVGLYGETIGVLPFGWGPGPLEEVRVWRVP